MAPAGYTASPAFPWTDSGGVITLAEPLSVEELQTGALVLRVRRDGAEAVDAVGVASVRASDQTVISVNFYCYGVKVAQMDGSSGYQAGVFEISWVDRGHSWEVVGFRIDKQYWHGGTLNEALGFENESGEYPANAEAAIPVLYVSHDGVSSKVSVSVNSAAQIGGAYKALVDGLQLTAGSASIQDGITVSDSIFNPGWPIIKGLVIFLDNRAYLQFLYPSAGDSMVRVPLINGVNQAITSLQQSGPFYFSTI